MKKAIYLAFLILCLLIIKVRQATPQETTIQSLIDNASKHDTIYLPSGTYYEHLVVNKSLTLVGAPTTIDGNGSGACVEVMGTSPDTVIFKNIVVQNAQDGFYLILCSNCIIENCTILNAHFGISMDDARNETIENNVFRNNHVGIHFYGVGNTFVDNWFENSDSNAIVMFSSNNTFKGNTFVNNYMGIYVAAYSNYNSVYNNTFINSTWANMQIWLSHSNLIYYNNFFKGIGEQVVFEGTSAPNFWNNSKVGNYWSDYNGTDKFSGEYQNVTGSDGIGDVPYYMTENNVDSYPLMTDPPAIETIGVPRTCLHRGGWGRNFII